MLGRIISSMVLKCCLLAKKFLLSFPTNSRFWPDPRSWNSQSWMSEEACSFPYTQTHRCASLQTDSHSRKKTKRKGKRKREKEKKRTRRRRVSDGQHETWVYPKSNPTFEVEFRLWYCEFVKRIKYIKKKNGIKLLLLFSFQRFHFCPLYEGKICTTCLLCHALLMSLPTNFR